MKKLKNFSGGRGYYVDDVLYLQEQLDRLKSGGYSELGAFVLSGCNVDGTSLTAGMVYVNDKMIYWPGAQNITFPCYLKEGTALEFGERYYDVDDATKPAFSEDRLDLVTVQPISGQYITIQANNSKQTFLKALDDYLQSKSEPDFDGLYHFKYRKDSAGFVHCKPSLYITGNDEQTSFQLPDGCFPAVIQQFQVPCITWIDGLYTSTAKVDFVNVEISTTGAVTVTGLAIQPGPSAYFTMLNGYCYQFKAV